MIRIAWADTSGEAIQDTIRSLAPFLAGVGFTRRAQYNSHELAANRGPPVARARPRVPKIQFGITLEREVKITRAERYYGACVDALRLERLSISDYRLSAQ